MPIGKIRIVGLTPTASLDLGLELLAAVGPTINTAGRLRAAPRPVKPVAGRRVQQRRRARPATQPPSWHLPSPN
jgi:hypothetical protein